MIKCLAIANLPIDRSFKAEWSDAVIPTTGPIKRSLDLSVERNELAGGWGSVAVVVEGKVGRELFGC